MLFYAGAALVVLLQSAVIGFLLYERHRTRMAVRRNAARISDLESRMTTSQEAERAHLARELHDDIVQRLAALSIGLSGLKRHRQVQSNPELGSALISLQQRTTETAEAVRQLSHDLHPSALDHVALRDALRGHCADFSNQYGVRATFEADPDVDFLDPTSALCLYRVAQEALRNVAKHAHATSVHVALRRTGDQITVSVADDGIGFDYGAVNREGGLGLRSLDERVRLARGRLTVESAASVGTTVSALLPVAAPKLASNPR